MRLVNDSGLIYRLSERAYRQFMKAGARGVEPNARDFGKCIGQIAMTTADAKPDDYRMALEMHTPRKATSKSP